MQTGCKANFVQSTTHVHFQKRLEMTKHDSQLSYRM